ncbi:hypothetical protein [Bradyrhizobium liaoningense]
MAVIVPAGQESAQRFSEEIMLEQQPKARWRFMLIASRFGRAAAQPQ